MWVLNDVQIGRKQGKQALIMAKLLSIMVLNNTINTSNQKTVHQLTKSQR